ncbi:MAG: hypothetical protein IT426_09465 [Pirellulales bacterium]|nr:hypothetical protein [Pirellulales bacterium]
MQFLVSILQCLARILFGAIFAEAYSPRFRGPAEAFPLRVRTGDDHWPRVGWMKVCLLLEEFGGLPRPCMAPPRTPNRRVNPRAKSIRSAGFSLETSPPSYLRTCFPPPDIWER